jgi:hypothetical protein
MKMQISLLWKLAETTSWRSLTYQATMEQDGLESICWMTEKRLHTKEFRINFSVSQALADDKDPKARSLRSAISSFAKLNAATMGIEVNGPNCSVQRLVACMSCSIF